MPPIRDIEDLKKSTGFETGTSAHYETSWDALKLQIISLRPLGRMMRTGEVGRADQVDPQKEAARVEDRALWHGIGSWRKIYQGCQRTA